MELYSKGCEHVMRALVKIIQASPDGNFSIQEVCCKNRLPFSFTQKIFRLLTRKGYLEARTGPKGGYRFLISPEKISVLDIVKAVDGKDAFEGCVMGFQECRDSRPCALHKKWKMIRSTILQEMEKTSLVSLRGKFKKTS